MEHASRSFKASRMRRRVGSAIAWRVRSREGSGVDVVMDGLGIAGELTAVNIRNQESEIEDDQRHTRLRCLLLQDRIVTIADEPGAHGFRILDVGKGPDLNVEELIRARSICRSGILFFL